MKNFIKNKLLLISIIVLIIVLTSIIFIFIKKSKSDIISYPKLELIGNEVIYLEQFSEYIEPGYTAFDKKDGNLSDKVIVNGEVNTTIPKTYEIRYKVTNSRGYSIYAKRFVKIKESITYKETYDKIDNTTKGWGTNSKKDGTRPNIDISNEELLKYNAYAMGPDKKVIYLTFDEGSMDTYLPDIVEVLNKNDVKATFFLCRSYIKNNPNLIKDMLIFGHSIGNHTATHPSMPSLATKEKFDEYLNELRATEKTFKDITGKDMDKIYREPRGEYSLRSLSIIKDLGYKTYFWSAAYQDWDNKISKEQALKSMLDRIHNGAIYLLHPTSKGNYLALDEFIKTVKKEGYTFELVKNI